MFKEYKIIDDGIWLPRHELQRCYDDLINCLKANKKYSHINSRTLGQFYLLEELIFRIH